MAAVRVTTDATMTPPRDTAVLDLVFPVFVTSALVVAALLWMLCDRRRRGGGETAWARLRWAA